MKLSNSGDTTGRFFRCREVSFHTGTRNLDPRICKSLPLKTDCRYAQVHLKTGFIVLVYDKIYLLIRRLRCLRYCTISWKVAGSISDGVIVIFHLVNPSGRIMALVSTQPLTEMNTRNVS